MINEFINRNEYQVVVCRRSTADILEIQTDVVLIEDMRSAAFYAMGVVQASNKKALVIVEKEDLSNLYTAVTEAWFQATPIHVLALVNDETDIDSLYNRCFCSAIDFNPKMKIDIGYGPVLIRKYVEKSLVNEKVEIIDLLKLANNDNLSVVCSNNMELDQYTKEKYNVIQLDGDYGVLSTFFGITSNGCENKVSLCTPNQLMLDINVFNNRYIKDGTKIIVIGKVTAANWLEENGFMIFQLKDVQNFWKHPGKAMLFTEE